MNLKISQEQLVNIVFFAAIGVGVLLLMLFSGGDLVSKVIGLSVLGVTPFLLMRPYYLWVFLFLVNPSLRVWAKNQMVVEQFGLNVNAIIHFVIILVCAKVMFANRGKVGRLFKEYGFVRWHVLFVVLAILSLVYSINKPNALEHLIRLVSTFGLFISTFFVIADKRGFYKMLYLMIAGSVVPGLIGYYQFFGGSGWLDPEVRIFRMTSTFLHPVVFGGYMALTAPVIWALSADRVTRLFKGGLLLMLVNNVFLAAATLTRGIWNGLIAMFSIYGMVKNKMLIALFAFVMFFAYLFVPMVQERVDDVISPRIGSSFENRITIVKRVFPAIVDAPFLGNGFGSFENVHLNYNDDAWRYSSLQAHNDYLRIIIELGFVGLVTYVSMFASLLLLIRALYRRSENEVVRNYLLSVALVWFAVGTVSLGDNVLRVPEFQQFGWVYTALVFVYLRGMKSN